MSLCNVFLTRLSALVAVDTAAGASATDWRHASKLAVLAHATTVLAVRGTAVYFGAMVYTALIDAPTVDAIEERLPDLLPRLRDILLQQYPERAVDMRELELVVVGWSPARSRMVGTTYTCIAPAPTFDVSPINQYRVHGGDDSLRPLPALGSAANMELLARKQVSLFRSRDPTMPIGGKLIIADLGMDSVTVKVQCDLERAPPARSPNMGGGLLGA